MHTGVIQDMFFFLFFVGIEEVVRSVLAPPRDRAAKVHEATAESGLSRCLITQDLYQT